MNLHRYHYKQCEKLRSHVIVQPESDSNVQFPYLNEKASKRFQRQLILNNSIELLYKKSLTRLLRLSRSICKQSSRGRR
ncbi:hypothetical protein Csa_000892 [Cucumis sativus]|uniref:Uncharacterized protein n=1 Tax=Cucumis sativus TaxID=3659 RepID=A0A0A0LDI7_CUCSA|nr:hypothetical protein Csa_000892 [Cucumis sativus]